MRCESPCKTCKKHPCKEHKNCEKRVEYMDSYKGQDIMKASEMDGEGYRLLPM